MATGVVRTITQQASEDAQNHLTNASLSFQEVLRIKPELALKINQHSVYTDYIKFIKNEAVRVTFSSLAVKKYAFKPKLLAFELYGNIELYSLILRLNHMYSVSDFTEDRLGQGLIIPITSVTNVLDEVLIKEKKAINRNLSEVLNDVNSLP